MRELLFFINHYSTAPVVPLTTHSQQLLFAGPARQMPSEQGHIHSRASIFYFFEQGHIHPHSLAAFRGSPECLPDDYMSLGSIPRDPMTTLYEDRPKIIKKLTDTDLGTNQSLVLPQGDVESQFLRLMDQDMAQQCRTPRGIRFPVLDADDNSSHELVLKKYANSDSHVLMGNWKKSFVDRKKLKAGDYVGVAFANDFLIFKLVNKNN